MHKKRKNRKPKRKKPTLSKEYCKTESEVSNFLKLPNLNTKNCANNSGISIEEEIDFFTNSLIIENDSIEQESPVESQSRVGHFSTPQPASSYIQIEEVYSPVIPLQKHKIISSDEEILYIPSADEIANIYIKPHEIQEQHIPVDGVYFETYTLAIEKDSNMTRMVNRFNEEKNFNVIAASNLLKNQKNFTEVSKNFLYKTDDDSTKLFEPFFILNHKTQLNEQSLNVRSKKLITVTVKDIKFIEHPLQSEEHRLTNKLENLYNSYMEKIQQNLIKKIKYELANIREINKNLMKNASNQNFDKLENYIKQIKILRRKLHKEELELKNLIQNSLDTWVLLKNCRKRQGFNYTNFKLVIKMKEIDLIEDEQLWNERLQLELGEVFREEFEKYYKDKRNRKFNKNNETNIKGSLRKPDTELIRIDVEEILKNCTRIPGEPKILLGRINMDDNCKNLEIFRDYYTHILFDDEFVGVTKNVKLNSDFTIPINQSFGVYLEKKIPKIIKFEIYEKSKLSTGQKIAHIYYPLDICTDYTIGHSETIEFSSEKFNITAKLSATVYSDTELFDPNEFSKQNRQRTQISKDILKNWYENHLINPLDPDLHSTLNKFEENQEHLNDEKNETFNFNEDTILTFCSKDEIENNSRFNILRARHNNDMQYKDLKLIPLFENEIEDDNDNDENILHDGDWMDPIDLHKYRGKKYLRKLYDVIVSHCIQLNKNEDATNLLIGDESPTIRSIVDSIIGFFGPTRPLNPQKTSQISLPSKNQQQNFNIVVNVVRASGVPVRNFSPNLARRNSSASTSTAQNLNYGNVRPYVCISYKDIIARTMTADGSNPTFNEQLVLPISGNIAELKDEIKIQIFDEYVEDLSTDDNSRSMEVYQRIHVNWLGEYIIPISTIFTRQRIEGVFEMNVPKLLVGYTKSSLDPSDGKIPIENLPEFRETLYLWLYLSIEPQFDVTKLKISSLECSELKEVKQHIRERCILIKELQPTRFLEPIVSLANGKRVCLTRLLESIPLPFENSENLENLIRRYVSLIPIIRTSNTCLGLEGVWLNNNTILDTTWSSPKDLGVLLACFYMHLGKRCWLVLGIAFPYGEVAYVLTQSDFNYILINPCTGRKYFSKDVNCPLLTVQYIVGQDNIYCNLQRENRVSMTDFNFNDNSLWMPIFGKNNPAPIGGVHKLNYNYINSYSVNDLRKSIERKITKKINSWRSTRKTMWNRGFNHTLNDILYELEKDVVNDRVSADEYLERLTREFPNYKLFGFTLNFSYTNLSSISDRIKTTGIHLNTDRNVEFSVAVYLHQYPNNILSCWIFMLTAIPFI